MCDFVPHSVKSFPVVRSRIALVDAVGFPFLLDYAFNIFSYHCVFWFFFYVNFNFFLIFFITFGGTVAVMVDINIVFHACQDELMLRAVSTFGQSRERRRLFIAEKCVLS